MYKIKHICIIKFFDDATGDKHTIKLIRSFSLKSPPVPGVCIRDNSGKLLNNIGINVGDDWVEAHSKAYHELLGNVEITPGIVYDMETEIYEITDCIFPIMKETFDRVVASWEKSNWIIVQSEVKPRENNKLELFETAYPV